MGWKSESERHSMAKRGIRTKEHKLVANGEWGYYPYNSDSGLDTLHHFIEKGQRKTDIDKLYINAKKDLDNLNDYLIVIEFLLGNKKIRETSVVPKYKISKFELQRAINLADEYTKGFVYANPNETGRWSEPEERKKAIITLKNKYLKKIKEMKL